MSEQMTFLLSKVRSSQSTNWRKVRGLQRMDSIFPQNMKIESEV